MGGIPEISHILQFFEDGTEQDEHVLDIEMVTHTLIEKTDAEEMSEEHPIIFQCHLSLVFFLTFFLMFLLFVHYVVDMSVKLVTWFVLRE